MNVHEVCKLTREFINLDGKCDFCYNDDAEEDCIPVPRLGDPNA